MREYQSADIRNVALVGHGAAGKTMLCESILACSGLLNRLGHIMNGNTASDYHEDEQKRKHSIYASLFNIDWKGKKLNILDTPGYADFVGESLGALRVADLATIVVNAHDGIGVGTEKAWEYAEKYAIPRILILTALDKENVKFEEVLQELQEVFGTKVMPVTMPVNGGHDFNTVIDVLNKKVITYKTDESGQFTVDHPSGEWKDKADELHSVLAECVAESDDALLEKFFDQGSLSDEEMFKGMHHAVQEQALVPLFCTSGESNIGITMVLDFIATYGMSPIDRALKALDEKNQEVECKLNQYDPAMFVFKTISEARAGGLSLFKIYGGDIKPGLNLYNGARKITERISQIFTLNGKDRAQVDLLHPGDIGAVVKLKDTHTNNTLCDEKHMIIVPPIEYPIHNITLGIKPKAKGDEEKLSFGLSTLHEEDPTLIFKMDSELRQMLLEGQGELHIDIAINKLKKRFGLDIDSFVPRIPYRETIKTKSESKYRHKKQSGGAGQFAEVWMRIEPKGHDEGVEFTHSLVGQNVDRVFVPSVEKGVKAASEKGALAGYRVVGVKVDFYDGKQHPVDSKDIAFQIAGKFAFREAFLNAKPCLLEPIVQVTVKVPDDFTGDIMSDLSSRRGKILGVDTEGKYAVIKALVPQAELHRYSTKLRSIVGGRGYHIEKFDHYEEVPHELEQKIIEQSQKEKEEEE